MSKNGSQSMIPRLGSRIRSPRTSPRTGLSPRMSPRTDPSPRTSLRTSQGTGPRPRTGLSLRTSPRMGMSRRTSPRMGLSLRTGLRTRSPGTSTKTSMPSVDTEIIDSDTNLTKPHLHLHLLHIQLKS